MYNINKILIYIFFLSLQDSRSRFLESKTVEFFDQNLNEKKWSCPYQN